MIAVRCSGQSRGFRVGAQFFPYDKWVQVEEITPEIAALEGAMLRILPGVSGPDDAALLPFPLEGKEHEAPTVDTLAETLKDLQERFALSELERNALISQHDQNTQTIERLTQQNADQATQIAELQKADSAQKGQITALRNQIAQIQSNTSVPTAPESVPNSAESPSAHA